MSNRNDSVALKLVIDNSPGGDRKDFLLAKAVQAYWQARETDMRLKREEAAIEFLVPMRSRSPRGLVQKVQILENMVETQRSPAQIAVFAASIADDALSMSRNYLSRAK
jgi:hypothetical protein